MKTEILCSYYDKEFYKNIVTACGISQFWSENLKRFVSVWYLTLIPWNQWIMNCHYSWGLVWVLTMIWSVIYKSI